MNPSFLQHNPSSGRSPPPLPEDPSLPSIPESNGGEEQPRRRGSFSFLRRTKSGTQLSTKRSISGGKLTKKQKAIAREQQMAQELIPQQPPMIPAIPRPTQLQTFGGEDARPDSMTLASDRTRGNQYNSPSRFPGINGSATYSNVPIPPIPGNSKEGGGHGDLYARTESMTNRGRYSYASSAISTINSPRRVRRRKDPTPFNILIIGARNSGKTSFLKFLRTSLGLPARAQRPKLHDDIFDDSNEPSARAFPSFESQYLETEIEGERIGLTLWDSPGLDTSIVDLQLREMLSFLESKFEDTFNEEMKVIRSPGVRDTHIHCAFLLLDPARLDSNIATTMKHAPSNGGNTNGNSFIGPRSTSVYDALTEDLDLQVLRTLQGKTTVIPVITKADTITSAHMVHLKRAVWDSLKRSNLNKLEALGLDEVEVDLNNGLQLNERFEDAVTEQERKRSDISQLDSPTDSNSSLSASDFDLAKPPKPPKPPKPVSSPLEPPPYLPLSIISPDLYEPEILGRKFPWGFADPNNPEHCDFLRLKETVFADWRGELREASRDIWYEGWRTSRLNRKTQRSGGMGWAI